MSIEHRRTPRKRLQQFLTVLNASSQSTLGRMADISETGMMLISNDPLEQQEQLLIRILPPENSTLTALELNAEVMWVRQNQQHFGAGLQFHNVSPQQLLHIKSLISLAEY